MQRKKRIAVIGLKGLPAFGGAAAVGENILNELKENYDFTVLSTASHASKEIEIEDIKQIVFTNYGRGGLNTFIYYIKCLLHVLFHSYDLVYLHHAESGFITPFLKFKNKVIVTFHGVFKGIDPKFSNRQNKFFKFSEKLNVKYANKVISVSQPDAAYIKEKYGRGIGFIPNGVKIHELKTEEKSIDIFFAAGRIYHIKGLHLLLDALKKINFKGKICIAGDLDQVEEYKKIIIEKSKGLDIEYVGLIKEKIELLRYIKKSKLFVFPSLTEAMSMMLLEAVSTNTPVLASDIPSNKAVFTDEEVLYFETENVEDLKEKLLLTFKDKDQMSEKANNAFQKLKKYYTWNYVSNQYDQEFKSLLKE